METDAKAFFHRPWPVKKFYSHFHIFYSPKSKNKKVKKQETFEMNLKSHQQVITLG